MNADNSAGLRLRAIVIFFVAQIACNLQRQTKIKAILRKQKTEICHFAMTNYKIQKLLKLNIHKL
jgi:hypothetical protein